MLRYLKTMNSRGEQVTECCMWRRECWFKEQVTLFAVPFMYMAIIQCCSVSPSVVHDLGDKMFLNYIASLEEKL